MSSAAVVELLGYLLLIRGVRVRNSALRLSVPTEVCRGFPHPL
jgi:hypothetical protein